MLPSLRTGCSLLTRVDALAPQDEYSNEIAVMKELDHPNLVKLYEVIHDPSNNKLLMLMEYVEGGCVLAGSSPTQKVLPNPESVAAWVCGTVAKGYP